MECRFSYTVLPEPDLYFDEDRIKVFREINLAISTRSESIQFRNRGYTKKGAIKVNTEIEKTKSARPK